VVGLSVTPAEMSLEIRHAWRTNIPACDYRDTLSITIPLSWNVMPDTYSGVWEATIVGFLTGAHPGRVQEEFAAGCDQSQPGAFRFLQKQDRKGTEVISTARDRVGRSSVGLGHGRTRCQCSNPEASSAGRTVASFSAAH
jgi:hypothetical protein